MPCACSLEPVFLAALQAGYPARQVYKSLRTATFGLTARLAFCAQGDPQQSGVNPRQGYAGPSLCHLASS